MNKILRAFLILTWMSFFFSRLIPVSMGEVPASVGGMQGTYLQGLIVDPANPFQLRFIVQPENGQNPQRVKQESLRLIKYFLAALTIPEKDLWVNLSPYEQERVIPTYFARTEMGRDLLSQDYVLKQLTAALTYPEQETGRRFWDTVYRRMYEQYGISDVPVDTFNKVWITPERAVVEEYDQNGQRIGMITASTLNVMMETDYLAQSKHESNVQNNHVGEEVFRDVLLPVIKEKVNAGQYFQTLREIYSALILASWFKQSLRQTLLGQVYVDQKKVVGIDEIDTVAQKTIYEQYMEAYRKGAYNFIKEEPDLVTNQLIPRKYFSGGFQAKAGFVQIDSAEDFRLDSSIDQAMILEVVLYDEKRLDQKVEPSPGLEEKTFSPQQLQIIDSLKRQIMAEARSIGTTSSLKLDWENAAQVPLEEVVHNRDNTYGSDRDVLFALWHNQLLVRLVYLQLFHDIINGNVTSLSQVKERLIQANRVLHQGNGEYIYKNRTVAGKIMSNGYLDEVASLILKEIKKLGTTAEKGLSQDGMIISAVKIYWQAMYRAPDYLFFDGNNSMFMNLFNMQLRLASLKGISHNHLDIEAIGSTEKELRETMKLLIKQENISLQDPTDQSNGLGEIPENPMKATYQKVVYGGIDFNPVQLGLEIRRDAAGMPLSLPQQDAALLTVEGFVPVIVDVKPLQEILGAFDKS